MLLRLRIPRAHGWAKGCLLWGYYITTCIIYIQYIPRNMHTVFALLCFVVVIHWLIFPYPSGLLHWHCGNLTIAPVPAKQPWWIWIDTSCEFILNDCITTTKQSTTKPCAYFLGYTVYVYVYICIYMYICQMDCVCQRCHKERSTHTCADDYYCCWKSNNDLIWVWAFSTTYSISQEICTQFCCALLCCGYTIVHNEFTWSIYPYSSGLLCWHWDNR